MATPELIHQAAQAHAAGKLDEALSALTRALREEPDNSQALLLKGIVFAKKDQLREAVLHLEKVAALDASSFQARLWLSMTWRKLNGRAEALRWAQEAVALNPTDPQAQNQLGLALLDEFRYAEALEHFNVAVTRAPNVAQIHYSLGLALRGLHDGPGAIMAFRKAAQLAPNALPILKSVRQALMDEYDPAGAADCARAILRLEPRSSEAHLWLARALLEDNQAAEAQKEVDLAAALEPDGALPSTMMGAIAQVLGRIEDAEGYFRKSIEADPRQGSAYLALASNRRLTEGDRPLVDQMLALLREDLSENHKSQLEYGIGKALEDLGDYGAAMSHFEEANRLAHVSKFGPGRFDRRPLEASYDFAIRLFNRGRIEEMRAKGSRSELPIFVLGMMRSGTTLLEQVLSSHPLVGAAGEQRFWSDHRNSALSGEKIDAAAVRRLAEEYQSVLKRVSPGKAHVIDKMPVNYEMIGLIHLAFPRAKIVHAMRHPVDTCISIYTTPNRNRIEWAHDKADIVFVYEQYRRLMDHWRSVLPEGAMIEVRYEEMVEDREATTRRLIEFCGLEWDDACLRPEKNERSVVTPSVWQVRQPVYKSSLARWKRYEPWLGPFMELLPK